MIAQNDPKTATQWAKLWVLNNSIFDLPTSTVAHMHGGLAGYLGAICFTYANDDSPLSWHLSEAQKQKIREAWKGQAEQRQLLDDFLHGRRDAPATCPG